MKRGLLLVLAALLAPSAGAGSIGLGPEAGVPFSLRLTSLREARLKTTILQRYDFSCGSAALATLLTHHYKHPVSEEEVFNLMWEHGDRERIRQEGFSLLDMKNYLEANGYQADGFEASLDDLAGAGVPAIALVNENGYNHFVVIKGVERDRVVLGDPSVGTRVVTRGRFQGLWTNGILFAIRNRSEIAAFNRKADWNVRPRAPLGTAYLGGPVHSTILLRGANDF